MRLGLSAWAMPGLPIDEQVRIAREHGFTGLELNSMARSSTDVERLDTAERRRIRRLLAEAGLRPTAIAAHDNPVLGPDPEREAVGRRRLRATMELAAELAGADGPPYVVVCDGRRAGEYAAIRETLAEKFRALAEDAAARGVTLALEFHSGTAIDRPERIRWLLDAVGHPHFRLNHDQSHLDVMGYTIAETVRPLVAYVVHTHVKDQRGRYPEHEYLTPGDGTYDYATYLREMHAGGYRGYIVAEIAGMVQRKAGYDPARAAAQSYRVLRAAVAQAGVPIEES